MPLRAGRYTLHEVRDGFLHVDGGAMFGVVPRSIWQKTFTPDDQNRIRLAMRCLLIDTGDRKILVDNGVGNKLTPKQLGHYAVERDGVNIDTELARAGVTRADITDLILTHLHLDHAGGTTRRADSGAIELAFPNATYHLQRRQWKWAHSPSERDAHAFLHPDFELLERTGRLHLIEGETELYDGVQICVSEGHTVGMQLVRVQSGDTEVVYCGDLVPTRAHLRPHYHMAYDLYPLTIIEEKKMLLAQAVEESSILYFEHDPDVAACRVREVEGEVVAGEIVSF